MGDIFAKTATEAITASWTLAPLKEAHFFSALFQVWGRAECGAGRRRPRRRAGARLARDATVRGLLHCPDESREAIFMRSSVSEVPKGLEAFTWSSMVRSRFLMCAGP